MEELIIIHFQLIGRAIFALIALSLLRLIFDITEFWQGAIYMAILYKKMDSCADAFYTYFAFKIKQLTAKYTQK